jgi:hypothetical protein
MYVPISVSNSEGAGHQVVAAERPADVLASIPSQYPAGGLKIGDSVVEAARDAVGIDIADRAVVPTELLDKMTTDRGAAFGVHNKSF